MSLADGTNWRKFKFSDLKEVKKLKIEDIQMADTWWRMIPMEKRMDIYFKYFTSGTPEDCREWFWNLNKEEKIKIYKDNVNRELEMGKKEIDFNKIPYFEVKVIKVKRNRKEHDKKYYQEHRDHIIERVKKYHQEHREHRDNYGKFYYRLIKQNVLNILSNNKPHCVRCGCDDIRLLEINHKNGGGNQEIRKGGKIVNIYFEINKGRRKIDDLEILCKICNSHHYLELKYGKLPYKIFYVREEK